ncbi:hypothetical protein [Nocardioides sp.]|uniref:hypothetical protein n=1 Tax=Nocardioides sp. TaxID=35761 RepID=UPI003568DAD6
MSFDEEYRRDAEALLGISAFGADVTLADPSPEATTVGSEAALGYAWTSLSARASVHLFESHDAAEAAAAELRRTPAPEGRIGDCTVNGPMLLVVTGGQDSADLLDELLSGFAGEE